MSAACPRRSYGCVFKAHYKETGEIVAIKQVPVESDLQEIIKEISIMQQCNRYGIVYTSADAISVKCQGVTQT